jgi:hypothetical protein
MHIDWRALSHIAGTVVGAVVPGVAEAEQLAWSLAGSHGKEKQDRVVALVKEALVAEHGLTGKQFAQDADVEQATRSVIDAVVALQNIVGQKAAAAAP